MILGRGNFYLNKMCHKKKGKIAKEHLLLRLRLLIELVRKFHVFNAYNCIIIWQRRVPSNSSNENFSTYVEMKGQYFVQKMSKRVVQKCRYIFWTKYLGNKFFCFLDKILEIFRPKLDNILSNFGLNMEENEIICPKNKKMYFWIFRLKICPKNLPALLDKILPLHFYMGKLEITHHKKNRTCLLLITFFSYKPL